MPLTLQWFISFTVLKHSWINFSVQKGCILSSMASLLGQKDLSVGEGRGSEGEQHPTKTLCSTSLNTSNPTLFLPHSQLVGFPTQSNDFIQSRFIFSCWKLSIHAASLALRRHHFSKPLFWISVSHHCRRLELSKFSCCCGDCNRSLCWPSSS